MLSSKLDHNKNTKIIVFICCFIFLILLSCDSPSSSQTTSPQQKTKIKFTNKSDFDVYVYITFPPAPDTIPTFSDPIPAREDKEFDISPAKENMFYFEYMIPLGSITIPYYASNNSRPKEIKKGSNHLDIPELLSTQTTSSFLVIENDSDTTIWLQKDSSVMPLVGQSGNDDKIEPGGTGAYKLPEADTSLRNYAAGYLAPLRDIPNRSIELGKIYVYKYDASSIYLYSENHFDISAQKKIWTIPTYNEPVPLGRFFKTGLLSSRENPETNGYILTGSVHYEHDTVESPHVGAVPYLGKLDPEGKATLEKNIDLYTKPTGLNLLSFIEDSNILVYVGQVYYEDRVGRPCILSTDTDGNENAFYDEFSSDIYNNKELYGQKLAKWDTGTYAVGCQMWENDRQLARIYIAKIILVDWDQFSSHEDFWISPENDYAELVDLVYDKNHNMFVVLANTGNGSTVYFINAIDGSLMYPTVNRLNYWINGLFDVDQDYFVAGGYRGVSSDRGFITKINILTGNIDTQNPWLIIPTKYNQVGAGSFWYILPEKDGSLILAGWCVENRSNTNSSNYLPWLVKYNLNDRKIIWEQIYDDYAGYYIKSVHHNAIGSYLLEIYNEKTYHSYLISTDLLGKMSGSVKEPLPRNSDIKASQPGNPKITMNTTIDEDVKLSTPSTLNLVKGQNGIITLLGTWTSCQWHINGLPVAGSGFSYTFFTSGRDLGVYTVTAVVTNSAGEKRSASCRVTVTN